MNTTSQLDIYGHNKAVTYYSGCVQRLPIPGELTLLP